MDCEKTQEFSLDFYCMLTVDKNHFCRRNSKSINSSQIVARKYDSTTAVPPIQIFFPGVYGPRLNNKMWCPASVLDVAAMVYITHVFIYVVSSSYQIFTSQRFSA